MTLPRRRIAESIASALMVGVGGAENAIERVSSGEPQDATSTVTLSSKHGRCWEGVPPFTAATIAEYRSTLKAANKRKKRRRLDRSPTPQLGQLRQIVTDREHSADSAKSLFDALKSRAGERKDGN